MVAAIPQSQLGLDPTVAERGPEDGYEPLASRVAQHLRAAILAGSLPPGEPIRQEAVARELGISRIPVREALRELEVEGLVTIVPHSGARVATLDFEECLEIYEIRERVEPLAFARSAERISAAQVASAGALCHEVEQCAADGTAWIDVDRRFHLATYAAASPRLAKMIVGLWHATQKYRRVLVKTLTEDDFAAYHDEHRLMVHALRQRDTAAGEALVRMHIARSRARLSAHRELFDG
jgi:DNA-binding GntR family transcriptional regulator